MMDQIQSENFIKKNYNMEKQINLFTMVETLGL